MLTWDHCFQSLQRADDWQAWDGDANGEVVQTFEDLLAVIPVVASTLVAMAQNPHRPRPSFDEGQAFHFDEEVHVAVHSTHHEMKFRGRQLVEDKFVISFNDKRWMNDVCKFTGFPQLSASSQEILVAGFQAAKCPHFPTFEDAESFAIWATVGATVALILNYTRCKKNCPFNVWNPVQVLVKWFLTELWNS